jgi:hypothetical protein
VANRIYSMLYSSCCWHRDSRHSARYVPFRSVCSCCA